MSAIPRNLEQAFEIEGLAVHACVSPMSWAHPDGKLQMAFTLGDGLWSEELVYQKPFANCSPLDAQSLIESFKKRLAGGGLAPCPECGARTWNRAVFPSASRDARCENCWRREWRAKWSDYRDLAQVEQAIHDLEMARKGFTHRLDGQVHPGRGAVRQLTLFLRAEISEAEAAALLKQQGCKVQDDYQLRALPPPLTFTDAKAAAEDLDAQAHAAKRVLDAFGAKPADAAKAARTYWQARADAELAVAKQRAYGRWYTRAFKVQRQMEQAWKPPGAGGQGSAPMPDESS